MSKIKSLLLVFLLVFGFALSTPAHSTISQTSSAVTIGGNGSATIFSANFPADSSGDIQVILTNSTGQQTTLLPSQYSVALAPILPGSLWSTSFFVTYPLSGPPLASGNTLTISRQIPLQQLISISGQGDFNPQVVEQALDILEMQGQQISARSGQPRGTWVTGVGYNYADIVIDGTNGNNTGNLYICVNANTSGVWATDLANGYWTLALNVQAIINASPNISNNQLFGNISGVTAAPYGIGGSAFLDAILGSAQGSLAYRGASTWTALPPGTSGYFLETQGASANPTWVSAGGGIGTITGVTAGVGLAGGGTSGNVTLSLGTIANNSLLANTSGGTASPGGTTFSAYLDSVLGATQGAVIYRSGTTWVELAPGTAGQFLETSGASANPVWATAVTSAALDTAFGSTQGEILYRGASNWTVLAPGTIGQVLTTGGSAANPSWTNSSTGGLILLNTQTVSSASSIIFGSTYFTSTYKRYLLKINNLYTSDSGRICMQLGSGGGPTWLTSYQNGSCTGGSAIGNILGGTSTNSSPFSSATIEISGMATASSEPSIMWIGTGLATPYASGLSGDAAATNGSYTAIKIYDVAGGTITASVSLYGYSN